MSISSPQVLTHLRNLKPAQKVTPTLEQVQVARAAVRAAESLPATLRKPEFDGWSAADLVAVVEALGKYIAQSRKSAVTGHVIEWDHSGMLFPMSQADIGALRATSRTRAKAGAKGLLPPDVDAETVVVHIPVGWTSAELSRDVTQSVATAVVTDVTDAEIVRFIERHYRKSGIDLTADHVYMLVWMAQEGMLDRLTELDETNAALAAALTQAWDLLNVSAQDAYTGLATLAKAANTGDWDAGDLALACQQAMWTNPRELERVHRAMADLEADPSNAASRKVATSRLATFTQMAQRSRSIRELSVPEDINTGQAQQICAQAGLLSGEVEEKAVRAELRDRLSDMGLSLDLDREIGEGVRAWKLGLLEEFYSTRQARADGDLDWATTWKQVVDTVSS